MNENGIVQNPLVSYPLLLAIGLYVLWAGGVGFYEEMILNRGLKTANAEIEDITRRGETDWCRVSFSFYDPDYQEYFWGDSVTKCGDLKDYTPKDEISIVYDPEKPDISRLAGKKMLWIAGIVALVGVFWALLFAVKALSLLSAVIPAEKLSIMGKEPAQDEDEDGKKGLEGRTKGRVARAFAKSGTEGVLVVQYTFEKDGKTIGGKTEIPASAAARAVRSGHPVEIAYDEKTPEENQLVNVW